MKRTLIIATLAIMSLFGTTACAQKKGENMNSLNNKKVLVAYFSWSGNTKAAADYIAQKLNADQFEIVREADYPTDYDGNLAWTKDRARMALRMERRLELALEGNRWFDLVRWGNDYLINTINTYMTEEAPLRPYYNGRSVTASEIFLPVPLAEIDNANGLYKQY